MCQNKQIQINEATQDRRLYLFISYESYGMTNSSYDTGGTLNWTKKQVSWAFLWYPLQGI